MLEQYEQAIPAYERFLNVCYNNEKGQAYYRLAFCYLNMADQESAYGMLQSAQAQYEKDASNDSQQRLVQIKRMANGIRQRLKKAEEE